MSMLNERKKSSLLPSSKSSFQSEIISRSTLSNEQSKVKKAHFFGYPYRDFRRLESSFVRIANRIPVLSSSLDQHLYPFPCGIATQTKIGHRLIVVFAQKDGANEEMIQTLLRSKMSVNKGRQRCDGGLEGTFGLAFELWVFAYSHDGTIRRAGRVTRYRCDVQHMLEPPPVEEIID